MKKFLKFVLLFVLFSIFFVLPNVIIPLHVKMDSQSDNNALMIVLLLPTQFFILIYLIKRLNLWEIKHG